jgi:uncharacterized protein (DUF58 family)
MAALQREPLLSAAFLERLRAARGVVFRRVRRGEGRGAGFGPSAEVEENRPYEPGDDPRAIDWKLFARLERLWVRLYLLDNESQLGILVDTSGSMRRHPRKALMAARFAAAYAWLALAAGRTLRVGAYADGLRLSRGPFRALAQFPEVLGTLAALPDGGRTSLGRGISGFFPAGRARGILVVVSDFLQEEDALAALERARIAGAELHLVQVLDDPELDPALRGDCRVLDAETGERIDLVAGRDLEADLGGRVRAYAASLAAASRARGWTHAFVRASVDFEEAFFAHLLGRSLPGAPPR